MTIDEYKQIVARIQAILATDAEPSAAELEDTANDYDLAVKEVNLRLNEFEKYQLTGFRFEGLQLADEDPPLQEAVRVLDLPELPLWLDYLKQCSMPTPPPLAADVVIELGEAYTAAKKLEKVLREHRQLALARADLRSRSEVLRKLKKLDAGFANSWEPDLKEYEAERLKELATATNQATAARDFNELAEIAAELKDTPWSSGRPASLIKKVSDNYDRLRREAARKSLYQLADDLNTAFGENDKESGKRHHQKWLEDEPIADLPPEDEFFDLAAPALRWIEAIAKGEQETAAFNTAVLELTAGLDDKNLDLTTLDRLEGTVKEFNREISNALLTRVESCRQRLELGATRRSRGVALALMVLAALVVAGTYATIQWRTYTTEVTRHAQQIDAQIQADNLAEAREYLNNLEKSAPRMRRTPAIEGLAATLTKRELVESGRVEKFEQFLSRARELGLDLPAWETFKPARDQLKLAEDIAMSPAEDARVKEVERELDREERGLQKASDEKFQADLKEVQKKIEAIAKDTPAEYVALLGLLGELQSRPHVSASFRAPIPALTERVKVELAAVERDLLTARHLSKISENVGRREKFITSLRDHAREQPGTTRAADFLRVADRETKLWDGIEAWTRVRDRWKRENLKTITSDRARDLLAEHQKLVKETPYPGDTGLADRLLLCAAVARRSLPDGTGAQDAMEKLFDSPAYKELYVVETAERKRYYTNEIPTKMGGNLNVRYYLDLDLEQKKLIKLPMASVPGAESKSVPKAWLSPQTRLRDEAVGLMKNSNDPWEELFDRLVQMLQDNQEIDPILKVQLLARMFDWASRGSASLAASLKTSSDVLSGGRLPVTANWLSPDDESVDKLRSKAKAILSTVVSQKKNFADAIAARDKVLAAKLGPSLRWVGWVRKDRTAWRCYLIPMNSGPATGELVVVFAGVEANSKPEWAKVGELENGRASIKETAFTSGPEQLRVEGRPVFLTIND